MPSHSILFVEASVGGVLGGSLTGILHLIRRLDRRRFAPALTARRRAMGEAARARVDAVFDLRHHVENVEGVLADVLATAALNHREPAFAPEP